MLAFHQKAPRTKDFNKVYGIISPRGGNTGAGKHNSQKMPQTPLADNFYSDTHGCFGFYAFQFLWYSHSPRHVQKLKSWLVISQIGEVFKIQFIQTICYQNDVSYNLRTVLEFVDPVLRKQTQNANFQSLKTRALGLIFFRENWVYKFGHRGECL
jgi:hypothetical protein